MLNYFFMTLTEILWLIPFLNLITLGAPDDVYPSKLENSFAFIGINVLLALILRRYLIFRRMSIRAQLPYVMMAMLVAIPLTIVFIPMLTGYNNTPDFTYNEAFKFVGDEYFPYGVIFIPIVSLLWFRGLALGKHDITPSAVSAQMRSGILFYFVIATVGTARIQEDMLHLMPLFLWECLNVNRIGASTNTPN